MRLRVRHPTRHERLRVPIPRRVKHHEVIFRLFQLVVEDARIELQHVIIRRRFGNDFVFAHLALGLWPLKRVKHLRSRRRRDARERDDRQRNRARARSRARAHHGHFHASRCLRHDSQSRSRSRLALNAARAHVDQAVENARSRSFRPPRFASRTCDRAWTRRTRGRVSLEIVGVGPRHRDARTRRRTARRRRRRRVARAWTHSDRDRRSSRARDRRASRRRRW